MSRWDILARIVARSPITPRATGPLIVCYHGIGGVDGLPAKEFDRQVEALKERRRVIPLIDAVALLGSPEANEVACITFDDGYRDYLEEAVPILVHHRAHATLFVPSGHIGGSNVWDEGLRERREVLDAHELRRLDPETTEVGVHGHSHCRLRNLTPAQQDQEIAGARDMIEAATGRPARLLAYPYGLEDDFDDAAENAVAAAGFTAACAATFGRGSTTKERFRLRRVTIEAHDSLDVVCRKIDGAYDWAAAKEHLGALKRARQHR